MCLVMPVLHQSAAFPSILAACLKPKRTPLPASAHSGRTRRFGDEAAEEGLADAEERASPVRSTAVAVFCFLGCLFGYFALLFVHLDDDPVDDFEIKARSAVPPLYLAPRGRGAH